MKSFWVLLSVAVVAVVIAAILIHFFNTVPQRSTVDSLIFSIYVVGGGILIFTPFDRKHQRSRWAKGLFVLSAALLMFVGIAELLRHYSVWVLSPTHEHSFSGTLDELRGIVLGLFLSLFFSGELAGRSAPRHDQT